jgi:hypothetical protein
MGALVGSAAARDDIALVVLRRLAPNIPGT